MCSLKSRSSNLLWTAVLAIALVAPVYAAQTKDPASVSESAPADTAGKKPAARKGTTREDSAPKGSATTNPKTPSSVSESAPAKAADEDKKAAKAKRKKKAE